jgi:P pilus assembly chaperone PapD
MKFFFSSTLMAVVLMVFPWSVQAQVTISPTAVFLDSQSKVGTFYVSNPSSTPVEVQLSFEFAYPDTDDDGRIFLNYEDEEAEEKYALTPYLRAFPGTFMLQPNERQTIRLMGRIPAQSDPGMYWSRMRISSNQATPEIGEVEDGEMTAQVAFQIDQVTAVLVRHGDVSTGLNIQGSDIQINDNRVAVLTDVERTGNSPFIGSVRTRIVNGNGEEVFTRNSSASVYFNNRHRVEFDKDLLTPGDYTVETTFRSSRNDISSQHLIQIDDVSKTTTFTVE